MNSPGLFHESLLLTILFSKCFMCLSWVSPVTLQAQSLNKFYFLKLNLSPAPTQNSSGGCMMMAEISGWFLSSPSRSLPGLMSSHPSSLHTRFRNNTVSRKPLPKFWIAEVRFGEWEWHGNSRSSILPWATIFNVKTADPGLERIQWVRCFPWKNYSRLIPYMGSRNDSLVQSKPWTLLVVAPKQTKIN